jgi:hypothetical protein
MVSDSTTALVVVGLLLVVVVFKQFSVTLLDILGKLTRPGATILLLLVVLGLFYKNFFYTALAFGALSVFLLKDFWVKYAYSDKKRLNDEIAKDLARFDAGQSIDLQFANRTAKHDPPALYGKSASPTLLVFPPSAELLHEMCG